MKIDNILIPTDFSEEATHAMNVGLEIARKSGASVRLLHIVDVPGKGGDSAGGGIGAIGGSGGGNSQLHELYMHKLLEKVKGQFQAVKEENSDLSIIEHVEMDKEAHKLADFVIKESDVDLVVMGSLGDKGLHEFFVGSNTEKVIRTAKAPVLTVKGAIDKPSFHNIVFASDFIDVSERAINKLKGMQNLFSAKINFVTILPKNADEAAKMEAEEKIVNFANVNGFEHFAVNTFEDSDTEVGIRAFTESIDANLISLTTHGRTGLAHLFLGSVAEKVANHANTPVLTFNEHL